jgi:heptosyltransferase I
VLRLSAIGDCCHALAVLRSLQTERPDMAITWIVGKTEASLFGGLDGIDVITFDKSRGRRARRELAARLAGRRFDALLHMHASLRANLASRRVPADRRIGFDRARARDFQWLFTNERIEAQPRAHVLDGMFAFAEHIGVTRRHLRWDIPVDAETAGFAATLCPDDHRPMLCISPCSSQRARNFRNWRVERYAEVARYASERYGARILLTGGNTELERHYGERIADEGPDDVVNLVGRTSLKQLYAILQRSTALVCPDSGPAHMGTAAGIPVIGLYATSNPDRTGPYLRREFVVNAYPEAVRKWLGKSVDEVRWGQRVRAPDAMDLIRVEDVIDRIDAALGRAR